MKLWAGRFSKEIDSMVNDFNSSIAFDSRLYSHDIKGSVAHAKMLGHCNIISKDDSEIIIKGLNEILEDIEKKAIEIDFEYEDIHSFVEAELTKRYPKQGKMLHTARSRNDQVALDIRLYVRDEIQEIIILIKTLMTVLCDKAVENVKTVMPGYTHLQRAQPITFGHYLMAYASMLTRDLDRLKATKKRMNESPLGSGALATTTYPINREYAASLLDFDGICSNSLDGVSDRDFLIEICSDFSILMIHLSRFSEEIISFCSWEFKFIELDDSFSTGSSIMPQKKNPDIAELVRGKSGRIFGDLTTLLTIMKGIPLAYNKDMQEDKEAIFDAIDTVKMCLKAFTPMIKTMTVLKENMRMAAAKGFINATDCADFLTKNGLPFRDAYRITGEIVAFCIKNNLTLETMTLEKYKEFSNIFNEKIFDAISLDNCVDMRKVEGGPSSESVLNQIKKTEEIISK